MIQLFVYSKCENIRNMILNENNKACLGLSQTMSQTQITITFVQDSPFVFSQANLFLLYITK